MLCFTKVSFNCFKRGVTLISKGIGKMTNTITDTNLKNEHLVSMGKPITAPVLIPVEHKSSPSVINEPFMIGSETYNVTCVSFGSPHGVVVVKELENTDVEGIGMKLGSHALFPDGANIVFIQIIDREHIKARVWQQDGGKEVPNTKEAVSVAMIAAFMLGYVKSQVKVSMGGQDFQISWNSSDENVYLTSR